MSDLKVCLWFDNQAADAAAFYVDVFHKNGREAELHTQMPSPGVEKTPKQGPLAVEFSLDGQAFMGLNGGSYYTLTPAASLYVSCADQAEIDGFWDELVDDGKPSRCGWLTDKFGLSWQIVPKQLGRMMNSGDPAAAKRVTEAFMPMQKLDLAILRRAFEAI